MECIAARSNFQFNNDGQSESESEHASLIDEHDSFNSVAKQIRFVF